MLSRNLPAKITAALAAALLSSAASRAAIVTPSNLNPGDTFYVVYLTNLTDEEGSSDISTYDTDVMTDATNNSLLTYGSQNVTWSALASTSTVSAASRFNPSSPIYLPDGTEIAASGADLWSGSLLHAIDLEGNGTINDDTSVWTGTNSDGSSGSSIEGPKALGNTTYPVAEVGDSSSITSTWVANGSDVFTTENPFYAFSSELTVATAAPEPASAALLALAAAPLLARKRR